MSRQFNGSSDFITFAAGGIAGNDAGPSTVAFLWRPLSVSAGGVWRAYNAGSAAAWGANPFSDGFIYWSTNNGFTNDSVVGGYAVAEGWVLWVATKPNEAGSPPVRFHKYVYNTGVWQHVPNGSPGDTNLGPLASFQIGRFDGASYSNMRLAAFGIWGSVLSDVQIEGMTSSLAAWTALSPQVLLAFNQTATSDPVLDLTGGGGDQTAITGTSVSADEPAGWSYGEDFTGSGSASFVLSAAGSGTADRTGSGTATFNLAAAGAGSSTRGGDGSAAFNLAAAGVGGSFTLSSDPVKPMAELLLDCLCTVTGQLANAPGNCCLRIGSEIPADVDLFTDLCCEGLGYVSIGDIFVSDVFPGEDSTRQAAGCGIVSWGVNLRVGIMRCAPAGGPNGEMPSCADWTEAALQNFVDAQALRATACCFLSALPDLPNMSGMSVVVGRQIQANPSGGCVERYMTLDVQFPNCDC
jgi:hypothetical protein